MTREMIKELLDTCFLAKKVTETMPELPKGVKPRHIHILTSIAELGAHGGTVRVGDISSSLHVTMPSITKLIQELEEMKLLEKYNLPDDKRAAALSLTELGESYYNRYVVQYHSRLLAELSDMDAAQCLAAVQSIQRLYEGISKIAKEGFDDSNH